MNGSSGTIRRLFSRGGFQRGSEPSHEFPLVGRAVECAPRGALLGYAGLSYIGGGRYSGDGFVVGMGITSLRRWAQPVVALAADFAFRGFHGR